MTILRLCALLLISAGCGVLILSLAELANAQTPSDACTVAIVARESQGNYYAQNASSGAFGKYQFIPTGGVFSASPWAAQGRSVYSLTPADQEQVYAWAVANYGYQPWGGC